MFSFFKRPISPAEQGGKREVLLVTLPLILGTAAHTIMMFTDRIFLAQYSNEAFQAVMPAGVLSYVLICTFHQVTSYASTFVAQYNGAKSPQGCLHATAQGLWLSLFSIPFILLLTPLGLLIIAHSKFPEAVIPEARIYFLILMLGGLLLPLTGAISAYFTGKQLLKLHVLANIIGALLNIPLDYLLIFGNETLGVPAMGIRGAAYATVISGCVPFVMQFWWYLRSHDLRVYGWRPAFRLDFPLMWRIIHFGLPSAFQVLVDVGSFALFTFIIGRLGAYELTAGSMCFSVNHLAFAPLMAIGFATSIVAARYQGARESRLALRTGWSGLKVGWFYMFPVALLFIALPEFFIQMFNPKASEFTVPHLLEIIRPMMIMMAVWGIADTVNIVIMSALRGVGDTRFVMLCMFIGGWAVWMPAEYLALRLGYGLLAMWGVMTVYILLLGLVFAWRWHRAKWMSIQVIEPNLIPTHVLLADIPQD